MSWTSPLTVPITTVPIDSAPVSASSGLSTSSAPAIAVPAISISGTKKSPRSNRAPTSSSEGISASYSSVSGPSPAASPALVSSSTAGAFPTRVRSYSWRSSSSLVIGHLLLRLAAWLGLVGWAWSAGSGRLGLVGWVQFGPDFPRIGVIFMPGLPLIEGTRSREVGVARAPLAPPSVADRAPAAATHRAAVPGTRSAVSREVGVERRPGGDRARRPRLVRLARHRGRAEGQQDLAERRAVQRHRQADPVGAADQVPAVHLGDLLDHHVAGRAAASGQAAGSGQLGEADGLAAMHDLGQQHRGPVDGLRPVRAAHGDPPGGVPYSGT